MRLLLKNVILNQEKTDILIENNKFLQISKEIKDDEAKIIDACGKAIFPPFYNTHNHAAMIAFRGRGEDKELFQWLNEDIWPLESKLNDEITYHASKFAILEMIKSGTVFFNDMYFYTDTTIKAVEEMGVRAVISFTQFDMFDEKETQVRKQTSLEFLQKNKKTEMLTPSIACHALYTVSDELIKYSAELCQKFDTYLHIHAAETQKEVDDCIAKHGLSPIKKLEQLGALSNKTILAHCVHLSDEDISIIKKHNVNIAHCPSSNLKLNSGQISLQKLLDSQCNVTLGTDSACSNNSLNMLNEMRIAALSAKNQANNVKAAKVSEIFKIATQNGAQAFGVHSGKIETGYLADFILVDVNHYSMLPNNNLLANLIYSAENQAITDVFCNGKAIMQNREVANEKQIVENFKKILTQI